MHRLLMTMDRGYLFTVKQGKLDLHEARRLGNLGSEALESNAIEEAAALFRQALDLWHGPALVDVQAGPVLRLRLTGIQEFRLTMLDSASKPTFGLGATTSCSAS
jgi:hypothetical protein